MLRQIDNEFGLNFMDTLYILVWCIGATCAIIMIILDIYLVSRLKAISPKDYEEAGSPNAFWNDLRQSKFMSYILKKRYKQLPEPNLIFLFDIARILRIIFLACFVSFLIIMLYWVIYDAIK